MLLLVLLGTLIQRDADGLTSLGAALMLLLAVNPMSIASVSLQLSFASVFGMLTLSPPVYAFLLRLRKRRRGQRLRNYICSAAAAGRFPPASKPPPGSKR